ncbi:MAG TPA: hypothetical protein VLA24_09740 [Pseudomonadales bacterium]|nr:hypothetical protein [Pseudomonadales bacterium]
MKITIPPETSKDIQRIYEITKEAFPTAPHTDHTEHIIVNRLREECALSLSIIAEVDRGRTLHKEPSASEFMSSLDVKKYLKISDCTLMHLRESGALYAIKEGRRFLYHRESVEAYQPTHK